MQEISELKGLIKEADKEIKKLISLFMIIF